MVTIRDNFICSRDLWTAENFLEVNIWFYEREVLNILLSRNSRDIK